MPRYIIERHAQEAMSMLICDCLRDKRIPNYEDVKDALLTCPTADVQVAVQVQCKQGKWEVYYDDDDPQDGIWKCSACGYIRFIEDSSPTNFCPNCGSDMRKGTEDGQGE